MPQRSERGTRALPAAGAPTTSPLDLSSSLAAICPPCVLLLAHPLVASMHVLHSNCCVADVTKSPPGSLFGRRQVCCPGQHRRALHSIDQRALDTPARLWSLVFRQYYSARTSADASSPSFSTVPIHSAYLPTCHPENRTISIQLAIPLSFLRLSV